MTKDEMIEGFAKGRILKQKEWSTQDEIDAVDDLLKEGKCEVISDWQYHDYYQCKVRKVKGVVKDAQP